MRPRGQRPRDLEQLRGIFLRQFDGERPLPQEDACKMWAEWKGISLPAARLDFLEVAERMEAEQAQVFDLASAIKRQMLGTGEEVTA